MSFWQKIADFTDATSPKCDDCNHAYYVQVEGCTCTECACSQQENAGR